MAAAVALPKHLELRRRLRVLRLAGALSAAEEEAANYSAGGYLSRVPAALAAEGSGPLRGAPLGPRPVCKGGGDDQQEKAECPICFDRYCSDQGEMKPIGVLLGPDGRRARDAAGPCRHFFHVECVTGCDTCPMCRRPFSRVGQLPNVADARQHQLWFSLIDADGDGALSKREVVDVLRVTMPVVDDVTLIERYVNELWPRVDRTGSGTCTPAELPGLFRELGRRLPGQEVERKPPRLTMETKREWFSFWDEDGSGGLDKAEMTRALVKTFRRFDSSAGGAANARGTLDAVWCIFDESGDGVIDIQEFCAPDGLGDAIILAGSGSPPASGIRQPSDVPGWTCGACTFKNDIGSQVCAVCETPRG